MSFLSNMFYFEGKISLSELAFYSLRLKTISAKPAKTVRNAYLG
jgi:hypothetical protein